MPNAVNGFVTAMVGVLNTTILYYLLKGFVDAGVLSAEWLIAYEALNLLTIFAFVHVTRYWRARTFYLLRWRFGFGITCYSGLVDVFEFAIDSIVLALLLLTKLLRR